METLSSPVRALFEAARELDDDARHAYLESHCADALQRIYVERLLKADAESDDGSLAQDPATLAQALVGEAQVTVALGQHVGPFELIALIGEGGSSSVFRAVRESDGVRQEVALKLLRRGVYTIEAQRLFRRERQALAQLRHPSIARLIEGGVTEAGVAYIALELIEGLPITEYAQSAGLDLRQRTRLFLDVCRAVEAAHGALIVHRDLKPANVLVNREGQVKLLDFGIAKQLDGEDETQTRHAAFTPAYAAPEQRSGARVTAATDVYALGVLLGELITGQRLFDGSGRTPSSCVQSDGDPRTLPAPLPVIRRALRGDLDTILLKATATEPERRYVSATAFAEDIRRLLDGEPVAAHPPSRWYRTSKFVARHRAAVASTGVFLLAILAALALAVWQERRASQEARRANAVRDFVERLFDPISNGIAQARQPSLHDLLVSGVARMQAMPSLGASERVDLLSMFARLHENLGELERARELAVAAATLAESELSGDDVNAVRALATRGFIAVRMEDYVSGGADLREAHRRMRELGIRGEALIELLEPLGTVETMENNAQAALAIAEQGLVERISTWGVDDRRVGIGYNNVASALEGVERYEEAADAYRITIEFLLAHVGPESNEIALAIAGRASSEYRAGLWGAARKHFIEALEMFARVGTQPQITRVYAAQKLCMLEGSLADRIGVDLRCAHAAELSSAFGTDSAAHGNSIEAMALGHVELGDLDKARDELLSARQLYPDNAANRMRRGRVDSELAAIALLQGHADRARALLPAAILNLRTRDYRIPPLMAQARLSLACAQAPGSECPADLRMIVEQNLVEVAAPQNPQLIIVQTILARLDLLSGQSGNARQRLVDAIDHAATEMPPDHPRMLEAQLWLALALASDGDCASAAQHASKAWATAQASSIDAHPFLAAPRAALDQADCERNVAARD
ncbi:MAG: serine/threonine-protein kinase [Dokdonella sp.]